MTGPSPAPRRVTISASPYWNGTEHAIRYVCRVCAEWCDTGTELAEHITQTHPDIESVGAVLSPLTDREPPA